MRGTLKILCNPVIVAHHAWIAINNTGGGNVIECGVYEGFNSAFLNFLIRRAPVCWRQFAADTFAGFPSDGKADEVYSAGELAPNDGLLVQKELNRVGVEALVGRVENTLPQLRDLRFSFVFLDLDLEEPTRFCWDFFRDKVVPGGRLGFHDYGAPGLPGITRICDEILKHEPNWKEVFRTPKGRDGRFFFIEKL